VPSLWKRGWLCGEGGGIVSFWEIKCPCSCCWLVRFMLSRCCQDGLVCCIPKDNQNDISYVSSDSAYRNKVATRDARCLCILFLLKFNRNVFVSLIFVRKGGLFLGLSNQTFRIGKILLLLIVNYSFTGRSG